MGIREIRPKVGGSSPWGPIQSIERVTERGDVLFVSTASHGGVWMERETVGSVDARWSREAARWSHGMGDQWYEEDVCIIGALAALEDRDDVAWNWVDSVKQAPFAASRFTFTGGATS